MIAKDFRHKAWEALRGHWVIAVLTGLVAGILGGGAAGFGGGINFNIDEETIRAIQHGFSGGGRAAAGIFSAVLPVFAGLMVVALVWMIVMLIIGGAVDLGYAQFNLDLMDGCEPRIETLFSRFSSLGTGIAMRLLMWLFTFLWTLLFIIPGIIAAYRYAMTPYILAEHPEMKVMDAIDASKQMMKGNKFRLFCLQFSFIGWHLLTLLTFGILSLWVHPYTEAANAAFYREISGSSAPVGPGGDGPSVETDGWSYGSTWSEDT